MEGKGEEKQERSAAGGVVNLFAGFMKVVGLQRLWLLLLPAAAMFYPTSIPRNPLNRLVPRFLSLRSPQSPISYNAIHILFPWPDAISPTPRREAPFSSTFPHISWLAWPHSASLCGCRLTELTVINVILVVFLISTPWRLTVTQSSQTSLWLTSPVDPIYHSNETGDNLSNLYT